jgi:hypothetical protein
MSTDRGARAGCAAGLAAAFVVTGTLVAAPAAQARPASTYLVLSTRVSGEKARVATLRCDPPRGTHPKASAACAAVAAARGDLTALRPQPGIMCMMLYRPATATARGVWRGRWVHYTHTFSNSCVLGAQTGAVFEL